jgi:hypothetical protein
MSTKELQEYVSRCAEIKLARTTALFNRKKKRIRDISCNILEFEKVKVETRSAETELDDVVLDCVELELE